MRNAYTVKSNLINLTNTKKYNTINVFKNKLTKSIECYNI